MAKFKVHYTGQWDEVVEADGSILAEMEAAERNSDCWIAEGFKDGDEEE
jgi:hypothetical protein